MGDDDFSWRAAWAAVGPRTPAEPGAVQLVPAGREHSAFFLVCRNDRRSGAAQSLAPPDRTGRARPLVLHRDRRSGCAHARRRSLSGEPVGTVRVEVRAGVGEVGIAVAPIVPRSGSGHRDPRGAARRRGRRSAGDDAHRVGAHRQHAVDARVRARRLPRRRLRRLVPPAPTRVVAPRLALTVMRVLVVGAGGVGSAIAIAADASEGLDHIVVTDLDGSRADARDRRARRAALRRRARSTRRIAAAITELARAERDRRDRQRLRSAAQPGDLRRRVRRGLPLPRHGDDAVGAASRAPVRAARGACSARSSSRPPTRGANAGCSRWSAWAWSPASPTSSPGTRPIISSRTIDEIGVRDGADLVVDGYDFAPTFSIWTTIEECLNPPLVWERERGFFTLPPFSEPETFVFPEGIGPVECVHVEHEEVLLIPRWVDCERVSFKYGLGAGVHRRACRCSRRPASRRPRRCVCAASRSSPRDVVAAVLPDPVDARRSDARSHVRGNVGHGHRRRRRRRARSTCTTCPTTPRRWRAPLAGRRVADRDQPGDRPRVARRGAWEGAGVLGPEAFDPVPFLDRLAGRGEALARRRTGSRRALGAEPGAGNADRDGMTALDTPPSGTTLRDEHASDRLLPAVPDPGDEARHLLRRRRRVQRVPSLRRPRRSRLGRASRRARRSCSSVTARRVAPSTTASSA